MKAKISKRLVSFVLVMMLLIGAVQASFISTSAVEASNEEPEKN